MIHRRYSITSYTGVIFLFCALVVSCSPPVEQEEKSKQEINPIKGKWKLQKRKFDPDTVFTITPDSIEYMKIITDRSFVWCFYNKKDGAVVAMAGGSYELQGGSYLEHIEFSYPAEQNMAGSDIPFKCEVNGDEWLHYGFINDREFDEEIGDYVVLRERRLEEVWKRVE